MALFWIFLLPFLSHAGEIPKSDPLFPYAFEQREGIYSCTNCACPLFRSQEKYPSYALHPTFTYPIEKKALYYQGEENPPTCRYRVLCRGCHAFLGHVFKDGPPPKHLRYTILSSALTFQPL